MNLKTIKYLGATTLVSLFAAGSALAQSGDNSSYTVTSSSSGSPVGGVIALAFWVLMIVAMWKIFTKAGQPGWASIIPFYNVYILLKIAGKPGWWLILFLIPFVNFIMFIIVSLSIAKAFGKGAGFGVGLFLLSFVFYPILAFSDATYQGPPK